MYEPKLDSLKGKNIIKGACRMWSAVIDQALSDATWKKVRFEYWLYNRSRFGSRAKPIRKVGEYHDYVRSEDAVQWIKSKSKRFNGFRSLCDMTGRDYKFARKFVDLTPEEMEPHIKDRNTRVIKLDIAQTIGEEHAPENCYTKDAMLYTKYSKVCYDKLFEGCCYSKDSGGELVFKIIERGREK